MYSIEINVNALNKDLAVTKAKQAESIIANTDSEALAKVAELFANPGACEKFKGLLDNIFVQGLLK